MRHVEQGDSSSLCAHACLAMLTGRSLARVAQDLGHERDGLGTSEIIGYLRRHGRGAMGPRFRRLRRGVDPPVPTALCQVSWYNPTDPLYRGSLVPGYRRDTSYRHLVVWAEGRYWDPENALIRTRKEAERAISPYVRGVMTSYLGVR